MQKTAVDLKVHFYTEKKRAKFIISEGDLQLKRPGLAIEALGRLYRRQRNSKENDTNL